MLLLDLRAVCLANPKSITISDGQDFATASMYFSAITSKTKGYRMPQSSYDAFSMLVLVRAATVGLGLRLLPALTADRCC